MGTGVSTIQGFDDLFKQKDRHKWLTKRDTKDLLKDKYNEKIFNVIYLFNCNINFFFECILIILFYICRKYAIKFQNVSLYYNYNNI